MRKPRYSLFSTCVYCPAEFVDFVVEHAQQITLPTFRKHVPNIRQFDNPHCPLAKDYAVRFYKSKAPSGAIVFFMDQSRIEHFFLDQETFDMDYELKLLRGRG